MVATLVLGHGYPGLLTRFVSRYGERGKLGYLSAFLRIAQTETAKWAVIGALCLVLAGWLAPNVDPDTRTAFMLGSLTVIPMAMHRIQSSIAATFRLFISAYFPSLIMVPVLLGKSAETPFSKSVIQV